MNRVTYGPTSTTGSLSMNPNTFSTNVMSTDMYQFGQCIKNFAKSQFERQEKCCDIFDCEFNHCTILTYNVHSPNVNCKLEYHTDCAYDHNGAFKTNKNTQGKNTAVIVYSLGDSRIRIHVLKSNLKIIPFLSFIPWMRNLSSGTLQRHYHNSNMVM